MGDKLLGALQREIGDLPWVGQVRGVGLLIGVELVADRLTKDPFPIDWNVTQRVVESSFDRGLLIAGGMAGLIDGVAGDHIQLSPPYVVEDEHLDFIVRTLSDSISTVVADSKG